MSTPAELLLGTLCGELKTREDHQRRARDQCRLAIGGVGLVNGTFPVPEQIRQELESLKDAGDRALFESETLKLDGWTYAQQLRLLWTGPTDGPSGSAAASDDSGIALPAEAPEDFKQWLKYAAAMADPAGWRARQARRAWRLAHRLEGALRSRDVLADLRKLADDQTLFDLRGLPEGDKGRSLFKDLVLSRDNWLRG